MRPYSHPTGQLHRMPRSAMQSSRMGGAMPRLRSTGSAAAVSLLVLELILPSAGRAADAGRMPLCGPEAQGQVYCSAGTVYECRAIDPNSLERGAGWHWKMDILRSCGDPLPAVIEPRDGSTPDITYAPEIGGSDGQNRSGSQAGPGRRNGPQGSSEPGGQTGRQGSPEPRRQNGQANGLAGARGQADQRGTQGRLRPDGGQNQGASGASPYAGASASSSSSPSSRSGVSRRHTHHR